MSVLSVLTRGIMRGRGAALVGVAVVLAVGVGAGIASLVAAWRTEHAYAEYVRAGDVAEVVVNPSLRTDRARAVIETTPGVSEVRSDVLLVASVDDGAPRRVTEIAAGLDLQIRVSEDGRYVAQDRPVVHGGRMIAGDGEVFLSVEAAAALGAEVGDDLPLTFWDAGDTEAAGAPGSDVLLEPTGYEVAEVVGIGVFAYDALTDELYPRRTALVSPELAAPYLCPTPSVPDGAAGIDEIVERLYPPGCSVTYEYFSLRVTGGDDGVAPVLASIASRLEEESGRLPEALVAQDARYYLVPAVTADERERIDRSLDPSVTALQLFGVAALATSLGLAVLAVIRLARPARAHSRVWWQLGATRAQRAAAIATPLAVCAAAGLAGAVLMAWLASGLGPVASARAVDPHPALSLPGPVVLPAVGASVLVLLAGIAAASIGAANVTERVATGGSPQLAAVAARTSNVPFTLGVRAAVRGASAVTVLAAMAGTVVAVLGPVVFSANLTGLIETPARYGWSYDAAAITGGGYGDAAMDAITASLDRPEVDAWGVAALGSATVGGEAVPFVAHRAGFEDLPLPLVDGTLPAGEDELAAGALTAERLGFGVGDTVTVSTSYGSHTGTVSGLVVPPPLGPILTDRAGLGTGLVLSAPFLERAMTPAADHAGVDVAELADQLGSFVAIDLAPGVDPDEFMAGLGDVASWDRLHYQPYVYTDSVRPAQIADVADMRSAPLLLAAVVAVAMSAALVIVLRAAARTRLRELTVLRALGATGDQVRATLRWQALTIVGVGLAFGLPLGIAVGRVTWRAFAARLGVPPESVVPLTWTVLIAVGAVMVGLLAAATPPRATWRAAPAVVLRTE